MYVQRRYSCLLCDKLYANKQTLKLHINASRNTNGTKLKCRNCYKIFKSLSGLSWHEARCGKQKTQKCNVCCMSFYTQTDLKQHLNTHAPVIKLFKCSKCDKVFGSKVGRSYHVHTVHTSVRKTSCVFCGKTCNGSLSLIDHVRRHIHEKSYQCNIRSKYFHNQSEKNLHIRTHTGEKPYQCMECGKTVTNVANLIRHKYSHMKIKPNQCVFCGAGFITRRLLWIMFCIKLGKGHIRV